MTSIASCPTCDGTLYVCENHPDRPWAGDSDHPNACECGAGAACPTCWTAEKETARIRQMRREGRLICSIWDEGREQS